MNNKITFPRLASLLADRSGRSKRFSEDFLREFFALISETLEAQESVKVKGLGTFKLSRVEPRKSVDVTTGEPMEISGHTKVVFTPSKELAEAVNAPFEAFTAIEISDDANIDDIFTEEELKLQNGHEENSIDPDLEAATQYSAKASSGNEMDEAVITFSNSPTEADETIDSEAVSDVKSSLTAEAESEVTDFSVDVEISEVQNEGIKNLNVDEFRPSVPDLDHTEKEILEELRKQIKPEDSTESADQSDAAEQEERAEQEEDNHQEATLKASLENLEEENQEAYAHVADTNDVSDEISEDLEEFEEENSRRNNWVRGILIVFGAAVVALFATFIIWYVFATNDFNKFFNRTDTTAAATQEEGFVVGNKASDTQTTSPEIISPNDSVSDSIQENELEEDVPTAPSDVVVYDTISTTRYLTTMAKAHYGNYNLWPYIYEENQSFLGHPDRIRPGTPVVIPKLSKYGVDPTNSEDIEKAKKLGVEIYARYGKKI